MVIVSPLTGFVPPSKWPAHGLQMGMVGPNHLLFRFFLEKFWGSCFSSQIFEGMLWMFRHPYLAQHGVWSSTSPFLVDEKFSIYTLYKHTSPSIPIQNGKKYVVHWVVWCTPFCSKNVLAIWQKIGTSCIVSFFGQVLLSYLHTHIYIHIVLKVAHIIPCALMCWIGLSNWEPNSWLSGR